MATGGGERYFVRADKDAPLKGPYTPAQIAQSHSKGILKPGALLEPETAGEGKHRTVKELVEEKEVARAKLASEYREQDAERDANRERSSGNGQMLVGVLMLLVGIGATAATCGAGGNHFIVFTGLIVGGVVQLIRGSSRR